VQRLRKRVAHSARRKTEIEKTENGNSFQLSLRAGGRSEPEARFQRFWISGFQLF
jgi:hypothetical protein